jgi:hypothetical protein
MTCISSLAVLSGFAVTAITFVTIAGKAGKELIWLLIAVRYG